SDHYLLSHERDDEGGTESMDIDTIPQVSVTSHNALARIDPPKDAASFRRDVALDPGAAFTGTVLGPDGKPLAGARAYRLTGWGGGGTPPPLEQAAFTVRAFNLHRPRPVLFQHPDKGLVGILEPPKEKAAQVTVRLRPAAGITGRLVDVDGQPRANVELNLIF